MSRFNLPRVYSGSKMSAKDQDRAYREVERLSRVAAGPGVRVTSNSAGTTYSIDDDPPLVAKIASHVAGGQYTATLQSGVAGGTWADHPSGAVLNVWEYNSESTIPVGTFVELRREPNTGSWRFQKAVC